MAIAKHKSRRSELRESRVLARRVQRGDRRAFELLYASYEGGLFRVAHRLTGSSDQAAALVQATFTRALATLPERGFDSIDVGAHLFGTIRSLSYAHGGSANGNGNGNGNGHANGHAGKALGGGEHAREVVAANARLAPRQRLALALRDLEGRPDDEIALVLALGAGGPSVPELVARARLRLRAELALPSGSAGCAGHLADLSAYADGTLGAGWRAPLEVHLEECADCRAALFALREASQRYRAVPVPVPAGELSSRMAAALGAAGLPERTPALAGALDAARALAKPPEALAASAASALAGAVEVARGLGDHPPETARAAGSGALAEPAVADVGDEIAAAPEPASVPEELPVVPEGAVADAPGVVHGPFTLPALPAEALLASAPAVPGGLSPLVPAEAPAGEEHDIPREPAGLPEPAAAPVPAAPPVAEVPAVATAAGGRQTAMAVVMATLVLIGIVVTLVARDGTGSQKPAAPAQRTVAAATAVGGSEGTLPPLTLPQVGAPLLVASAAGGRVPLAPPRKLHHSRSGTRVFPHRSIPVRQHRKRAPARASTVQHRRAASAHTRRVSAARAAAARKQAPFKPQPIPAPQARRKVAIKVVPPAARPSTATPASADSSDQTQTQST